MPLAVPRGLRARWRHADARRSQMAPVWRVALSPTGDAASGGNCLGDCGTLNQSHRAVTAAERHEAMAPRTATALAHQNRHEEGRALAIQGRATPGQNRQRRCALSTGKICFSFFPLIEAFVYQDGRVAARVRVLVLHRFKLPKKFTEAIAHAYLPKLPKCPNLPVNSTNAKRPNLLPVCNV